MTTELPGAPSIDHAADRPGKQTGPPIDVLIVGAGPTGSALAIDLTRRGQRVRIIDKATHAFDGSRAKGVQPRTLEVLDDLGALPDILEQGSLYPPMGLHLGPVTIPLRMMAKATPGPDVPYPNTWLVPQSSTDRALHTRLETLGGKVEFGTELLNIQPGNDQVTATITTAKATDNYTEEIIARFLVGADGGGSIVRKQLGVPFSGSTDDADRILIVDAPVTGNLSRDYWHIWPGLRGRFIGACPLPHSELFQWMIRLAPDEQPPRTADDITHRIQKHTHDKRLTLRDIAWKSVFRPNIRLAERYRHKRVFLAGDAAHVHTPAGAQGLNTGIGDAYNLGWKLAQVLAGADDALLDSYEQERRPVAAAVLGLSTRKYQGIGKLNPSSYRRGKDEKQLVLTYHGGPLASKVTDRTATLRVGDRAPDAGLLTATGERVRLFELYRGHHFTAIGYGHKAAAALNQLEWPTAGAPLQRLGVHADSHEQEPTTSLVDSEAQLRRIYGLSTDTLLLVRPDGYIGYIAVGEPFLGTCAAIGTLTPP